MQHCHMISIKIKKSVTTQYGALFVSQRPRGSCSAEVYYRVVVHDPSYLFGNLWLRFHLGPCKFESSIRDKIWTIDCRDERLGSWTTNLQCTPALQGPRISLNHLTKVNDNVSVIFSCHYRNQVIFILSTLVHSLLSIHISYVLLKPIKYKLIPPLSLILRITYPPIVHSLLLIRPTNGLLRSNQDKIDRRLT